MPNMRWMTGREIALGGWGQLTKNNACPESCAQKMNACWHVASLPTSRAHFAVPLHQRLCYHNAGAARSHTSRNSIERSNIPWKIKSGCLFSYVLVSRQQHAFDKMQYNSAPNEGSCLFCLFVWCLTARQHRIGQFVPTARGWNRLSWLRMANETQCIIHPTPDPKTDNILTANMCWT